MSSIIVISGPSGVGKGTLIQSALSKLPHLSVAISATTRPKRQSELEGKDYYFLTEDAFDQHIQNQDFLEWCYVHQHRYGTLKSDVNRLTSQHKTVILEVDTQGAKKIRDQKIEGLIFIFIAPPSLEHLHDRLLKRNTESLDIIEARLQIAKTELTYIKEYDYIVINDTIEQSTKEILVILDEISL